jgi:hypothetical protein
MPKYMEWYGAMGLMITLVCGFYEQTVVNSTVKLILLIKSKPFQGILEGFITTFFQRLCGDSFLL